MTDHIAEARKELALATDEFRAGHRQQGEEHMNRAKQHMRDYDKQKEKAQ